MRSNFNFLLNLSGYDTKQLMINKQNHKDFKTNGDEPLAAMKPEEKVNFLENTMFRLQKTKRISKRKDRSTKCPVYKCSYDANNE